jgi:5-(carboxyamino)imidazole ribonucleotide mutase
MLPLKGLIPSSQFCRCLPGFLLPQVGVNAAQNAGILSAQIIGSCDEKIIKEVAKYKKSLKKKVVETNEELKAVKFEYKTN